MITYYTNQLKKLKPKINWQEFKRNLRTQRNWNNKHFENKYVEKILKIVLKTYIDF